MVSLLSVMSRPHSMSSWQPYVVRPEFVNGPYTQQLHGAADLAAEDFRRPIHTPLPARHQSEEIGPPDQRCPGTQSQPRDDIGASEDAGVEPHLGPPAHGFDDVGEPA